MKRKYILLLGMIVSFIACHDEDSLKSEYEYDGPIPAIADGPSEAQKLCYSLYQKYDLHTYYTLAGDEALRTPVGWTQTAMFEYYAEYYNPDIYPMQAADEMTSESFLKLMIKFLDLLPEDLAKSISKRHVVVKCNLVQDDYYLPWPLTIAYTDEAQQGIIYWGDMTDEIGEQLDLWKYSITSAYFETRTSTYFHNYLPVPSEFANVSAGKYLYDYTTDEEQSEVFDNLFTEDGDLNMDFLMSNGFVDPFGMIKSGSDKYQFLDMTTYATWIVNNPLEERQNALDNYPLVKLKYDLTIKYYKENLKLDLETFGKSWLTVTID